MGEKAPKYIEVRFEIVDDQLATVVANSAALTLRVPNWSRVKLTFSPALIEHVLGFDTLNPRWPEEPGITRGKLLAKAVSLVHRECDVPACHLLSLMWGTGWPALWVHDNLAEVTHQRAADLFGATSVHYYRHVRKIVAARRAVKYDPSNSAHTTLPDDYLRDARDVETPMLLTTGAVNRVFTDSNIVMHRLMERRVPGRHELAVFPRYGHQDVFMGKDAARDVFPRLKAFIDQHRDGVRRPARTRADVAPSSGEVAATGP